MNTTTYRWKYLFGLQFQRVSHGREKWQQAPDMAIRSSERPHLEHKQETERVNSNWQESLNSQSTPSGLLPLEVCVS